METPNVDPALPGADLIETGISDLEAGNETEASLAVALAAPRLRTIGVSVPTGGPPRPSHRLYGLLAETCGDDAHGRYNAILRRVSSFARASEATKPTRA